jgi:hypothetical protein
LRVAKTFCVVEDESYFLEMDCSCKVRKAVYDGIEDAVNSGKYIPPG